MTGTTQTALDRARGGLGALRRRVLLHRRLLAAVLTGLAVLLGLHEVQAPGPATVPVWTAAHDLAPGVPLRAADLRRSAFDPDDVPSGAVGDPARLLGRVAVAPMRRGTPVTDVSVLGGPLVRADPGRVTVPVRLADPGVAGLLRAGDRVDLVAVSAENGDGTGVRTATTVATGARVVALPRDSSDPAASTGSVPAGRLVVVSVYPTEVPSVVAAGSGGLLTALLSG